MDLRGFSPKNKGCRYELGVLASASHHPRVVVLHDRDTARAIAEADIEAARKSGIESHHHFIWLPAERMGSALADRVLAALFSTARRTT